MKSNELNSLQTWTENLQCTLDCETEKNSDLQIDVSVTESGLKDFQQQCVLLDSKLIQLKQQHRETV